MSRPLKKRRVCALPRSSHFLPDTISSGEMLPPVKISLEEYECIRLLDYEGMTQEEASVRMGVARTTVTSIYESARKKIADSLVDGKRLQISGGAYQLKEIFNLGVIKKGLNIMRIAVTYEEGNIFQHFGHTEQFKLYDVEDGKIVSSQVVDTNGSGHGALAGFLKAAGADALICGGIGMGAQMALAEAGIKLYGGVQGSADEAAKTLAEGNLNYDPDAKCDHHGHGEDHDCGHADHECGHGSCHN